jgi:hypothetical protein
MGDTPIIASSSVTPYTASPTPFQQPPPLSLSQALPASTNSHSSSSSLSSATSSIQPQSSSASISSITSQPHSPAISLISSMSSASSSSTSSSAGSLALPEVWVALVLEPNKFTAQSLLHYCKLLSFHPDLSFAFDSPTDLLKFLAGGSTTRKRATSHRGIGATQAAARRRVVLFVHTQFREQIDRACAAGDVTIADRVYAWVWIAPAHGVTPRSVVQSSAFPQRMATIPKPLFFSDIVRCMLNLFQPIGGPLVLWSTYFPDSLYNSLGRNGASTELKFNREYLQIILLYYLLFQTLYLIKKETLLCRLVRVCSQVLLAHLT